MGFVKLGGISFKNLFSRPVTKRYPVEPFVPTARTKGHVSIDIDACIFCSLCARKCPAEAIEVDKPALSWSINHFLCVQCGDCVRTCPKHCLTMEGTWVPVSTGPAREVHVRAPEPEDQPSEQAS